MTGFVTISAKISKTTRQRMRRLGVSPSKIIKRAIDEELKREQAADIERSVKSIQKILKKIPIDEVVDSIREDRDSR